ncbi:MAG: c-type cytochrome [Anaerolinea sp.]|nr:c-type cytochrome [Anaerolinea sp.]
MQVKIIIGTISFMLTMIILGFAAIREPARLAEFTLAREGRQVESGAALYESQCATCHGVDGDATECYDVATGEQIGCQGLPLNYNQLLCGDTSARMTALNWEGSKAAFIQATISSGRYGTSMPTWAQEYGGPLRTDEIVDITRFVLNWETVALCSQPLFEYPWPETIEELLATFPTGDAARGEELYTTYGCSGCHGNLEDPASAAVGPWQGDLPTTAGTRVEGLSGAQYVYESILYPNNYVVPECPNAACTDPSSMPSNFPLRMGDSEQKPQDLIDIMAFLGMLP